ncbi:efflux RND transporter periplasmic adaptor subunit [Alkalibacterium sp. MB6]|uniref:efflux RND transporter periplasmic adaptor subunit n=1 Tax=Alkalibacterium sp. MB6 TaxID=2081965 RepID=UPI001379801A|nr:HlyD family efflux transporter periplasmic adaptor subunit [Alkalibacterium sp. MB6]
MKGKKWIALLVFLAFVGFIGMSIYNSQRDDDTVTVRTAEVSEDSITEIIVTTGMIEPSQTQEVMGQGIVTEVPVSVGDTVEEGDTLVTYIDGTSFSANFSGTVTEVNVTEEEPDTNAQQGQAAIVVSDLSNLQVSIELSRSDASQVDVDQDVLLSYGDMEYEGTVSQKDPVATQQQTQFGSNTTLGATISFDENTDGLIAGFEIDVDIKVDESENTLVIPIESLNHDEENNPYVFVFDGTHINQVNIETGIQADSRIEVIDGLSAGDQVVLSPDQSLEDGMEVELED